jgi:DNA topoisomerase-1
MEEKLDEVEYGKVEWRNLVKDYHDQLQQLISAVDVKKEKSAYVQDSGIACDVCGEGKMLVRHSKNGEFLACDRFPACKNSKNFKRDADGKIHIVLPTQLDEACPQCGAPLMEREGRYGAFIACSAYPKCKFSRPKTLGVKCPDCGTGEVVQRRNKRGRNFYSCNRYPDCKWISNDKPVAIACPTCGNPFMFEKYSKAKGNHKLCPKCKSSFE